MAVADSKPVPARMPRILSFIVVVLGAIMVIVGIGAYTGVSLDLRSQNIAVAAITADAPGSDAGKPVAGPFTAMAQINAIGHHVAAATGGKTFGQMSQVSSSDGKTYSKEVTAEASSDGQDHAAGSPLTAADATSYAARITAQQGSWTQASLYVSVLAFGVSAAIAGTGVVIVLIGLTLVSVTRKPRVTVEA